jgi:putative Mn2+ efflux pump MntP
MRNVSILLALLIPLTLDTFVLSGALSLAGLHKRHHLRTSLVLALFEALMPAVGVLIGVALGEWLGHTAGYVAAAIIGIAGILLLRQAGSEDKEQQRRKLAEKTKGWAVLSLGLAISIDELAIGLSLGLLGVPLWLAAVMLGTQAFFASQLGFYLGNKLSDKLRDGAERLAGIILLGLAILLLGFKLSGTDL